MSSSVFIHLTVGGRSHELLDVRSSLLHGLHIEQQVGEPEVVKQCVQLLDVVSLLVLGPDER
jgi:hypothetical protein